MLRLASMMATAALLLSWDVTGVTRVQPPNGHVTFPPDENLPALPDMSQGTSQDAPQSGAPGTRKLTIPPDDAETPPPAPPPAKAINGPLQPESRLALVRYVSGENVRVVSPIPAGKNGIHLKAGATIDEKQQRISLSYSGAAINPGDKAQVTALDFKDRQIIVDINGGGRGKKRLRDRIHLEVGDGMPTMTTTEPDTPVNTNAGATIFLDFDKPLPDMTPDDLKQYLSSLLDFSNQHSAAVQWVDSLPPEIQTAITEKRPVVGMDHEMVLAAMGRPDRKVREKNPDGDEIEDWIYGKPPAKTIFVEFDGDKVTQIKQFPQ
jgi:hypothetical protein